MRVCVIGGGIAGAMLCWRLAQQPEVSEVLLAPGPAQPADATAVSGGSIRAFEIEPVQRALALESMAELSGDPVLARWAGFVGCGSVYVPRDPSGLPEAAAEINAVLGDSASLLDAQALRRGGWSGIGDEVVGILERQGGYLSPQQLRLAALADLAGRTERRFTLLENGYVTDLAPGSFTLNQTRLSFEVVVLATGAWTPTLLRQSGFDPAGLTTKGIQYTVHQATGALATSFVDDICDLFGKPVPGGVLLGLPTQAWGAPPTGLAADRQLSRSAAALAVSRFPALQLHSFSEPVTAVDCYAADGILDLRPVDGADGRLLTFTGGTGSAAKTVIAASRRAAERLGSQSHSPESHSPEPHLPGPRRQPAMRAQESVPDSPSGRTPALTAASMPPSGETSNTGRSSFPS
jgi:glycine/D-amino acid oxidase-like deaminating enzyme